MYIRGWYCVIISYLNAVCRRHPRVNYCFCIFPSTLLYKLLSVAPLVLRSPRVWVDWCSLQFMHIARPNFAVLSAQVPVWSIRAPPSLCPLWSFVIWQLLNAFDVGIGLITEGLVYLLLSTWA